MQLVGSAAEHAALFVQVVAAGTLVLLALPMVFRPLTWGRWLGWQSRPDDHLAIYFGRCLGAVASVLAVSAFAAAGNAAWLAFLCRVLVGVFAAMVLVHVWGAVRRIQPLSETIETLAWLLLLGLGLLVLPPG